MTSRARAILAGRPRRAGLTLIELIVAIGITSIILLLVNQIFSTTTRAMNMGITMTDVIAGQRAASEQVLQDANAMIGPGEDTDPDTSNPAEEGGFLVIVQYQTYFTQVARGASSQFVPRSAYAADPVRSDQLLFFRKREVGSQKIYPVTPLSEDTYQNDFLDATSGDEFVSPYVKVWYGHARKTLENGTEDSNDNGTVTAAEVTANDLGAYAPAGLITNADELAGKSTTGANRFAHEWVLARQAMFLVDTASPNPALTTEIHANSARYDAAVSGYTPPSYIPNSTLLPHVSFMGLTDIAAQALGSTTRTGSVLYDVNAVASYPAGVAPFLYLAQRLRVNPNPTFNTNDTYAYAAWQSAQMHPVFFAGVSDFIVEFAADYENNDTPAGYDPDNLLDRVSYTVNITLDRDGNPTTAPMTYNVVNAIKWYGHWYNDPVLDRRRNPDGGADLAFDPYEPAVFEPPTPISGTNSFEYVTTGLPGNANAMFVFRHDADDPVSFPPPSPEFISNNDWPYLIRMRYRAHDARGLLESGDAQHGVWTEHVIKVNRN